MRSKADMNEDIKTYIFGREEGYVEEGYRKQSLMHYAAGQGREIAVRFLLAVCNYYSDLSEEQRPDVNQGGCYNERR